MSEENPLALSTAEGSAAPTSAPALSDPAPAGESNGPPAGKIRCAACKLLIRADRQRAHKCPQDKIPCSECGAELKRGSLGYHLLHAHGVKSDRRRKSSAPSAPPREKTLRRSKKSDPADPSDAVPALFAEIAAQLEKHGDIADQCVKGLRLLLEKTKKLRLAYIKNTAELNKLRRESLSLNEEDNS